MKTDKERKQSPLYSGVIRYFPDALVEVAQCSYTANEQHNPGEPMHWNRNKSPDELDSLTRHLLHAGEVDTDGIRHSAKVAWRAMANLQKEIESDNADNTRQDDEQPQNDGTYSSMDEFYKDHPIPIMEEEDVTTVSLEEAFNLPSADSLSIRKPQQPGDVVSGEYNCPAVGEGDLRPSEIDALVTEELANRKTNHELADK